MSYSNYFTGKRITMMGLGLLGRGVGDAAFLAKCGAKVLITDKKSAKELAPSIARLKRFPNIRFRLGGHDEKDFRNADMVLKAAGVPLDSPYIKEAQKNRVPVYMSTALFVKLLPPRVTFIGITGTRGKTTTTHLIHEILIQHTTYNIQHTKRRVFLGGNIQGVSTLALLPSVRSGDFVVLELDSWQLQGFRDLKISPHISVFTTFLPDHMNYYGGNMKKYFEDKAGVFKRQKTRDKRQALVVGEQAVPFAKKWESRHAKRAIVARAEDVPKNWKLKILGEHNRYNAACALAAADALGVPRMVTKKTVESFRSVPGRLELVREVRGVKIYNDTTATTPDATIAALRALSRNGRGTVRSAHRKRYSNILQNIRISVGPPRGEKRRIVLIMGGADKGLDMSALIKEIPKWCKAVVLLAGTGTDKFQVPSPKFQVFGAVNLKKAIEKSYSIAKKGDTILFSPAFASFGMFKNEYDRGEKFNHIVWTLAAFLTVFYII